MDLSDDLNPIFVLHTRRSFKLLRKYPARHVFAYLIYFIVATAALIGLHEFPDFEENLRYVVFRIMVYSSAFCVLFSIMPLIAFYKGYHEKDLFHSTLLTPWEVFSGYFYTGVFHSFYISVFATLIYFPCVFFITTSPLVPVGYFFLAFFISQAFSLCIQSFLVEVRTSYKSNFFFLPMCWIFGLCIGGVLFYDVKILESESYYFEYPFHIWGLMLFYTVPTALVAFFLTRQNFSSKKSLLRKCADCVFSYLILAGILFSIRILILFLYPR